jgi:hypothetical protein
MQTSRLTDLPPLRPGTPGRPSTPRYRQQYGLIIVFDDEEAQKHGFDALVEAGFKPRVVVT